MKRYNPILEDHAEDELTDNYNIRVKVLVDIPNLKAGEVTLMNYNTAIPLIRQKLIEVESLI